LKLTIIAAYDLNKIIGHENKLPWHLPEDLKHFKESTLKKIILMGKNTYLSIGKPLPNRTNVVISSTLKNDNQFDNLFIFKSVQDALDFFKNEKEIIVIGGSSIYNQLIAKAEELIITKIHNEYSGDAHFPSWEDLGFTIDVCRSKYDLISSSNITYDIIYLTK